jgi:hypothetical protein
VQLGGATILRDVNLTLNEGEIYGLLGPEWRRQEDDHRGRAGPRSRSLMKVWLGDGCATSSGQRRFETKVDRRYRNEDTDH